MMCKDYELNVNMGVYMVMKVDWMTGEKKGKCWSGGLETDGNWDSDKQNSSRRNERQ